MVWLRRFHVGNAVKYNQNQNIRMAMYKNYHKVQRNELDRKYVSMGTKQRIVAEFKERVVFTKKFYKGRFDERHKKWMRRLSEHINLNDKLGMSLDACIAVYSV